MSKYTSHNDGAQLTCFHEDPECVLMKKEAVKREQDFIEYHDLSPCHLCSDGEQTEKSHPNMKYQNVTIDPENDTMLDRL